MKAAIAYGLLGLMVLSVGAMGWRTGGPAFRNFFRDDVLRCGCGNSNITYTPSPPPPGGSQASYYIATCQNCGLRRQVVDLDWTSASSLLDAWLDSGEHPAEASGQ